MKPRGILPFIGTFTAIFATASARHVGENERGDLITIAPALLYPRQEYPSNWCGFISDEESRPVQCPSAFNCVFSAGYAGCCEASGCNAPFKTACIPRSQCSDGKCEGDDRVLKCTNTNSPYCIAQVYTAKKYTSWICDNEDYDSDHISEIIHNSEPSPTKPVNTPATTTKENPTTEPTNENGDSDGDVDEDRGQKSNPSPTNEATENSKETPKQDTLRTVTDGNGGTVVYKNGQTVAPLFPSVNGNNKAIADTSPVENLDAIEVIDSKGAIGRSISLVAMIGAFGSFMASGLW